METPGIPEQGHEHYAQGPEGAAAHGHPQPQHSWPANELEEVLSAALGRPEAGGRIVEVLGRSHIWIPLPKGGNRGSRDLDLPTLEIEGQAYVPVFSSEHEFMQVTGGRMDCTVAPAVEFARGLPPQVGLAVNPDGTIGVPLPPPAVAELARSGRTPLDGPATGGRVVLSEPDWQDDPVDFLAAVREEFDATGVVLSARRCLAVVEDGAPSLFIGVELARPGEGPARDVPLDALGRALGRVPVAWPVNLVFLDVTQDPVADWLRSQVRPFYGREV
ncbi:enhanced serine sensitivity protein SseB [Streptomyces sp. VRA16 Mangrove soil]|uniref:enhanced serine sensitivity protein SseB n=1 Tax=Streptomyces sp. VRA16 Mangrove soil TaxID=2817434 RepID=UPI001A9FFC60|nr:enhanced serine sensitivity protein SseB [Streptomyces sp. VRA16 Mangrove soil]MBO1336398.1 enhanced serine sensitivity protein SseB [Streptomyces sp. VRA16 Mangrove soil]